MTLEFHDTTPLIKKDHYISQTELQILRQLSEKGKPKHLEEGAFNGLSNLTELSLRNNDLKVLPQNIFEPLLSLTTLDLSSNRIASLVFDIFRNNGRLVELNLRNNPLVTLPNQIFQNLTSLELLDMTDCKLASLNPKWFENLRSLKELKLDKNRLTLNDSSVFRGLGALTTLSIKSNQLIDVPPAIFAPVANLQIIDLSLNLLDFINSTTGEPKFEFPFKNNTALQKIVLSGNRIDSFSVDWMEMKNLSFLDLSNNLLSSLHLHHLANFKNNITIDLSSNIIYEVGLSVQNISTQQSNASQNETNPPSVLCLDLRKNILKSFPPNSIWNDTQELRVKLSGNPLDCPCKNGVFVGITNVSLEKQIKDYDEIMKCCGSGKRNNNINNKGTTLPTAQDRQSNTTVVLLSLALALAFVIVLILLGYIYRTRRMPAAAAARQHTSGRTAQFGNIDRRPLQLYQTAYQSNNPATSEIQMTSMSTSSNSSAAPILP